MSIRVFISYAIEDSTHNQAVLDFAHKLQMHGIDVLIFTSMHLGDRLHRFMERIDESDFTLSICTPTYAKKATASISFGIRCAWPFPWMIWHRCAEAEGWEM